MLAMAMLMGVPHAEAKTLYADYKLLRGEVQQYGDWLVGCDNNAECMMLGFAQIPPKHAPREGAPLLPEMVVRISYAGSPNAASTIAPVVGIFPVPDGAADATINSAHGCNRRTTPLYRFTLHAGGKSFGRTFELTATADSSATTLSAEEADYVLQAYEASSILSGVDPTTGQTSVRFPNTQFTSALHAMRAQRKKLRERRGAMASDNTPGDSSDGSVAPTHIKPVRIRAKETIVSGFVPIARSHRCPDSVVNLRQFQFANGAMLWGFQCSQGTDQSRTRWYMASGPGLLATPLNLPEPREGTIRAGVEGLANAVFDLDFGILRSYEHRPGREDCGVFRAWGYTDQGWHLIERREMPLCKGLALNDWIRTHYLPTEGASSHE